MRKAIIYILIVTAALSFCNKGNDSTPQNNFTLQGTVYVDQIPAENILVEFGNKDDIFRTDWYTSTRYTDEDGKYIFSAIVGTGGSMGAQYRVRARDPFTHSWSSYRQGTAPPEQTITEDFYFSTSQ